MSWPGRVLTILLLPLWLPAAVSFDLNLSKEKVVLGEPIVATFTLRYDRETRVDRIRFPTPKSEDFEVEELNVSRTQEAGEGFLRRYVYLLTPVSVGTLTIPPRKIELSWQDRENYRYISHEFRTKPVKVTVREIPGGLKVVGDYRMRLVSDANRTVANHPVHLELRIDGIGNAGYIPPFDLVIPGASVYPSRPKVTTRWLGGTGYRKRFVQRFTVVADQDFTVPPLRFRYFNVHTEIPETLGSKALKIRVENPEARKRVWIGGALLLAGFLLGALSAWLWFRFRKSRQSEVDSERRIRKAGDDRTLYRLLLAYSDSPQMKPFLTMLEENLYRKGKHRIDRREIVKTMREIKRKTPPG